MLQAKLIGTGAAGNAQQGAAVAISGDGNTVFVGGPQDNGGEGAFWIFTRAAGVWTQLGLKFGGSGIIGNALQGSSLAISNDGNTAIIGGPLDNSNVGAAWIFVRLGNGAWIPQSGKLVGAGSAGASGQGSSVAISADGNTVLVGAPSDNYSYQSASVGAVWTFLRVSGAWVQQGAKLSGPGVSGTFSTASGFGSSVSLSADGNTALVGLPLAGVTGGPASVETAAGAVWSYTRANGAWGQPVVLPPGAGVSGSGARQGTSVALSSDGNTAIAGGPADGFSNFTNPGTGAVWVFSRINGTWTQVGNKLVGADPSGQSQQGSAVALSGDGSTILSEGPADTPGGAAWFFVATAQSGCTYALSTSALSMPAGAASQTVSVIAPPTCFWNAVSQAAWITITSADSGSGNGSVTFSVTANTTAQPRVGVVTFPWTSLSIAQAGPATLPVFNTGVNASGAPAADGAVDLHYSLFASADASYPGPAALVVNAASLPSSWTAGGATSRWIAPRADAVNGDASGSYTYRTTLDLTGIPVSTVTLTGQWASDGSGLIKLNGTPAGSTSNSTSSFTPFALASGLISGANILDFIVTNSTAAHPTGVNVEIGGAAGPAPAPNNFLPEPTGVTISPNSMTFTFADPRGWQDLGVVNVLINTVLDGRMACYVAFNPSTGAVYLVDDAGDSGGPYTGIVLPGSATARNSQCIINGAGSSFSGNGNTLSLTLAIAFESPFPFTGNKVVYLAARDMAGDNSGWQALATLPGGPPPVGPAAGAVTPSNGAGSSQTFQFTFSDAVPPGPGWQDIAVANILINSAIDGRAACYLAFVPSGPAAGSLYLVDDGGDAGGPFGGITLPGMGVTQNSQCTVNGTGSSVSAAGSTLTLTLSLSFSQGFRGNRIAWLAARNNTENSGWQASGSWTVQ